MNTFQDTLSELDKIYDEDIYSYDNVVTKEEYVAWLKGIRALEDLTDEAKKDIVVASGQKIY